MEIRDKIDHLWTDCPTDYRTTYNSNFNKKENIFHKQNDFPRKRIFSIENDLKNYQTSYRVFFFAFFNFRMNLEIRISSNKTSRILNK